MMSALPLASARLSKLRIPFVNDLLDGGLCKCYSISTFFFLFLVFKHNFIMYIDFTHIAASNTVTDDVTN